MFGWIKSAVNSIAGWLGDGIGSLFDWLLGGIATIFTAIVDGANALWDVFDSLWNFAVGFVTNINDLFTMFFPFIPAPVMTVISLGLMCVVIAGIVKKVRKE